LSQRSEWQAIRFARSGAGRIQCAGGLSHHDFWALLRRVYQGLSNNSHFLNPVDLALFKAKMDEYSAAITATIGGAKSLRTK
jgi:hypothetical protein